MFTKTHKTDSFHLHILKQKKAKHRLDVLLFILANDY